MEQRWTERIPVAVEVLVNYPSLGLVRGRSKDISLEGMFVETGPIALAAESSLLISLMLPEGQNNQQCDIPAQVVYSTQGGAGLVFCSLDVPAIGHLRRLLYNY